MGFFGVYTYKTKNGKKFWLHVKERGRSKLYYFSKEPNGAIWSLPKGYEVFENPKTSFPVLKKKKGGLFSAGSGGKEKEEAETG